MHVPPSLSIKCKMSVREFDQSLARCPSLDLSDHAVCVHGCRYSKMQQVQAEVDTTALKSDIFYHFLLPKSTTNIEVIISWLEIGKVIVYHTLSQLYRSYKLS